MVKCGGAGSWCPLPQFVTGGELHANNVHAMPDDARASVADALNMPTGGLVLANKTPTGGPWNKMRKNDNIAPLAARISAANLIACEERGPATALLGRVGREGRENASRLFLPARAYARGRRS